MPIPTEPIGSIPRPPRAGGDAGLRGRKHLPAELALRRGRPRHDREFEATGSPVITDGEQRKPNFSTYPSHGLADARPERLQDPVRRRAHRRMPRLTAGPFRYATHADQLPRARRGATPTAAEAGGDLALGAEPPVPAGGDRRLPARGVHRRLLREAETDIRGCLERRSRQRPDRLHGRAARGQARSRRRACSIRFVDLNNRVLSRFSRRGARADRRPHLPGRRPRFDPQRGRRLRRAAAGLFQLQAGSFYIQLASEADRPRVLQAIAEHARDRTSEIFVGVIDPIDPRSRDAGGGPRPGARGGPSSSRSSDWARPTTAASRRSATTPRPPRHRVREDPGAGQTAPDSPRPSSDSRWLIGKSRRRR